MLALTRMRNHQRPEICAAPAAVLRPAASGAPTRKLRPPEHGAPSSDPARPSTKRWRKQPAEKWRGIATSASPAPSQSRCRSRRRVAPCTGSALLRLAPAAGNRAWRHCRGKELRGAGGLQHTFKFVTSPMRGSIVGAGSAIHDLHTGGTARRARRHGETPLWRTQIRVYKALALLSCMAANATCLRGHGKVLNPTPAERARTCAQSAWTVIHASLDANGVLARRPSLHYFE